MNIGQRWDEKFSSQAYFYGTAPNAYIAENAHRLKPKGDILCLGEGEGRNALFLAKKGFSVTALDASAVGISKALKLAHDAGVSINVELIDLELWQPTKRYDGIITSYLHLEEPLRTQAFQKAFAQLNSGALFIGEFFSVSQIARNSGGPKKESLLYTVDSLKHIFSLEQAHILHLQEEEVCLDEGSGHQGDALVIRIIVQKR